MVATGAGPEHGAPSRYFGLPFTHLCFLCCFLKNIEKFSLIFMAISKYISQCFDNSRAQGYFKLA